ncbi:MAG: ROK family transcriptional regulator [Sumerlaeia bacterium]
MTSVISRRPDLVLVPRTETPAERALEKKRIRKHYVLKIIRDYGPISRAGISKTVGLNMQSVATHVDDLVKAGLVHEEEAKETTIGRRPTLCTLKADAAMVAGVDFTPKQATILLTNLKGEEISRTNCKAPANQKPDSREAAQWITECLDGILHQEGAEYPPLAGVGISWPWEVPFSAPELSSIGLSPLDPTASSGVVQRLVSEMTQVPVIVEARPRAMALASLLSGEGKEFINFVYLSTETSFHAAFVQNGRVMHGSAGRAGNLSPVSYDGGSLGDVLSEGGLKALAKAHGAAKGDVASLISQAEKGNAKALAVWEDYGKALAHGVAILIHTIDPTAVIIGGSVSPAAPYFLPKAKETLASLTSEEQLARTQVLACGLGEEAITHGATSLVLHHIFSMAHIDLAQVL